MAEYVDEKLIGGIVIKLRNTMLDGSVKAKLDKMQKQIRNIIA
jgi:F0F1-type ATP synthase delta subunit